MILIVEDEIKLALLLADYLQRAGFKTHCLHRGDEVQPWLNTQSAELIILDLMLPGLDGLEVCKVIRSDSQTPIIMTTAKVEEIDRLLGLELGADDYLCKPYSPRELVARVNAVLRRARLQSPSAAGSELLDDSRLSVSWGGESIELTAVEYHLVKKLVSGTGRIFSREQLMQEMYTDNRIVSDRTVDSHIKKIRKKLHELAADHAWIHSVYGAGYRFEIPLGSEEI